MDEAWLRRACRSVWDQVSGRPRGASVVVAPGAGRLVIKAARLRPLRTDRSVAAARIAQLLRAGDVPTPEVHAVCTDGARRLSALVMEQIIAVDEAEALASVESSDWVEAMATSIAAMHGAGVRHRDLKGSNVLLAAGESGPEAWIIDLEGASVVRLRAGLRTRARDLARLDLSLDLLGVKAGSLLERYGHLVGWSPASHGRARALMEDYKRRKRAQNARRGRELR